MAEGIEPSTAHPTDSYKNYRSNDGRATGVPKVGTSVENGQIVVRDINALASNPNAGKDTLDVTSTPASASSDSLLSQIIDGYNYGDTSSVHGSETSDEGSEHWFTAPSSPVEFNPLKRMPGGYYPEAASSVHDNHANVHPEQRSERLRANASPVLQVHGNYSVLDLGPIQQPEGREYVLLPDGTEIAKNFMPQSPMPELPKPEPSKNSGLKRKITNASKKLANAPNKFLAFLKGRR